jgi:hypothetical protein
MSEKLETYLDEIRQYLASSKEKQEILAEIKSHIMEKAEKEFGEMTENSLAKVINAYGSPRRVAERYMDDYQIIAPTFKGHLLRYTMILFAFHFGLTVISLIFKTSMLVFPFFYIPKIDSLQALFYLPMTFVFDLGLVGIILYFVTQSRREIKLPWPKLNLNCQKMTEGRREKPKIIPFVLMFLGNCALVYVYMRFHTLFFKSLNFKGVESLFNPEASKWYSLALLSFLGIGIVAYAIKFFTTSEWVNLLRSASQLVILGVVINRPIDNPFLEFIYLDLQIIANIIIVIIATLIAIDFLKSLVLIGKKSLMKNTFL